MLGGGSGTGITAIINQTCDIADHSREWKQTEIDLAKEKGISPVSLLWPWMVEHHRQREKSNREVDHARGGCNLPRRNQKLERGRRPNKAISLYGRQSNSGTYVFMQEHVLGNKNYSTDMKEMNGNAQMSKAFFRTKPESVMSELDTFSMKMGRFERDSRS